MANGLWRTSTVVVILLAGTEPSLAGNRADGPLVRVRVANHAGIAAGPLADAVGVAQSVLGRAGVETGWRDCTAVGFSRPCGGHPRSGDELLIDLFGRGQSRALAGSPDVLGVAVLPQKKGEELYAVVFLENAKALARSAGVPLRLVLGHALAHEAGHLLLGTTHHADTGLMRARWSSEDLLRAAQGRLRFSERESVGLREASARLPSPGVQASRGFVEPPPRETRAASETLGLDR